MSAPAVALPVVHPLASCCWCGEKFVRGKLLSLEAWFCPSSTCTQRQAQRAMILQVKRKGEKKDERMCRFVPLPRQVEMIEAYEGTPKYILIGGAAGGSKTKGLRELAHSVCMGTPGIHALLLRRTFKQLEDNHLNDASVEAGALGATYKVSDKRLEYPNSSWLRFGHCETTKDVSDYLSSEYDLIIFDELVTFEETQFQMISSRARTTKPGIRPKVIAGTNPGGPQSHWVRMRFIDQNVDLEQYPNYNPENWRFIPSKLEDNPYLNKEYEDTLLDLPPELRKAYRDGDWDIFPGQYFPEWRKKTHVTAEHRVYPADLPRVLSMDWGFVKPGSVGWWVLVDGHAYREAEYVFTRTTAFRVGEEIAARTKAAGLTKLLYLVYDTAMEIPNNDSGESTIETVRRGMRAGGLSLATRPADKDRVNGWQRLRHWLGQAPDGTPWLQTSPACAYFNRTLPSLVSDETHPEDVDTDGEDHAADEARYFVMSRPTPGVQVKSTQTKEWSLGWLKQLGNKPRGPLASRRVA